MKGLGDAEHVANPPQFLTEDRVIVSSWNESVLLKIGKAGDAHSATEVWRSREHLRTDPDGGGPYEDEYETASLYFDTAALDVFTAVDPMGGRSTGSAVTARQISCFSSASCGSQAS